MARKMRNIIYRLECPAESAVSLDCCIDISESQCNRIPDVDDEVDEADTLGLELRGRRLSVSGIHQESLSEG